MSTSMLHTAWMHGFNAGDDFSQNKESFNFKAVLMLTVTVQRKDVICC